MRRFWQIRHILTNPPIGSLQQIVIYAKAYDIYDKRTQTGSEYSEWLSDWLTVDGCGSRWGKMHKKTNNSQRETEKSNIA